MKAKVPTSETGTTTPGIAVARQSRRNRKTTSTTRATEIIRACSTSRTEARMVTVWSSTGVIVTSAGSSACSSRSASRIRSTVSMMLAPGWR